MFSAVLISMFTLMLVYIFWRMVSLPYVKSNIPPKWYFLFFVAIWLLFFLGRTYGHNSEYKVAVFIEFTAMNLLGIVFIIFVFLLFADIFSGFGYFIPRFTYLFRGCALIFGIIISIIALVQGLRSPVIQNYEIVLPGLPLSLDGKVIVALSDTHIGSIIDEDWMKKRILQINEQDPDLIFLLGDIVEGHGNDSSKLLPVLKKLSAPLGVYTVLGNHEFHRKEENNNYKIFKEAGFHVLRNSYREIGPGLLLIGVDDLANYRRQNKNKDEPFLKFFLKRPPGPSILLSHTPWYYEKASDAGIDLMLSGHTHGGQLWPFDYLVKLRYPMLEGEFKIKKMILIVTRGAGTWGPVMRLWSPGEILRITLRRKL